MRVGPRCSGFVVAENCAVSAGWMGRRVAPTRADPTGRPQVLGRLHPVLGPPARLHVWALLSCPKQNHRSRAANVLRSRRSFTQPQSSEVIERVPLPSAWHHAWELSLPLSQHSYFLSPLRFLLSSSWCFGTSGIREASTSSSINKPYGIYITVIYYSSVSL